MNANYHYRAKYGAKPTTVDNVRFDSKREAERYRELKVLLKAGVIRDLELHPRFALTAKGVAVGAYVADFSYRDAEPGTLGNPLIVEDVKGVKTAMYRWKKRHFEIEYAPVTITEIR